MSRPPEPSSEQPSWEAPGPHGGEEGRPPSYGHTRDWPRPAPSAYAPRMPPAYPPYPHARREPYHRILRTWSYHFWRVLVGIPVTVLAAFLGPLLVGLIVGLVVQMLGIGSMADLINSLSLEGRLEPATLLVVNLSLALLIPITWLAVRFLHNLRPRWLGSVVPRLRWSLVGWFLVASVVSTVVSYAVAAVFLPHELPTTGGGGGGAATGATTAAFVVIILLTQPLQAAGEEYFFRGYLLQAFGALVRAPWFTVVCTSLLFATAHGSQNLPLFIDRFAFGVVAGGLVIFTGGIEAGIAMHVVNNLVVLVAAAATGTITQTLGTSEAGWALVAIDLGQFVLYAGLVVLLCRWLRPQALTSGPPEGAESAPPSGPPAAPATAT